MTLRIHNLGQGARRLILATLLVLTILAGGVAVPALLSHNAPAPTALLARPWNAVPAATQAAPSDDDGLALVCPGTPRCSWL